MSTFTLTTLGLAALINAANTGVSNVVITQIGLTAQAFTPSAELTALPGEHRRLNTFGGQVVAPDTIHLTIRDETAAAYNVRGFALYLSDGTLLGVHGQADFIVQKTTSSVLLLAVDIRFSQAFGAVIEFGPAEFLYPPATHDVAGVVKLATVAEVEGGHADRVVPADVLKQLLGGKQASLGFTPVRQGGGQGMGGNIVFLGWDGDDGALLLQVDNSPLGPLVLRTTLDLLLGNKSNVGHGHAIGSIAGLQDALDARVTNTSLKQELWRLRFLAESALL